jgi:hypothetical protein
MDALDGNAIAGSMLEHFGIEISARAHCPVLPVTADQPSVSRPAIEPVLVT